MYLLAYPFMALASILFAGMVWALSPVLALFVNKQTGNLPRCLYWCQTFDATCFEGRQPQYGMTGSDWSVAAQWLRRNPGYGLDYFLLGVAFDVTEWTVTRNDGTWFIARGPNGQFNVESSWGLKLGWKARNYRTGDMSAWLPANYSWGPSHRTSICFSIKL